MVQSPVVNDPRSFSELSPLLINPDFVEPQSTEDTQQLKHAFELFNELSLQLADSYQHLEQRVADLTDELDVVSQQRLQELQQKEQLAYRLETLINCLPAGVVVLDKQGVVVESNPVAQSLLQHELRGVQWRVLIQKCFAPRDDDGHEVSTKAGKRISITTRSIDDHGQIILLTDQTETRQLQAELSRNERLSALGRMVSTLAHQVRTPLSSAMLYANHLHESVLDNSQRQAFTDKLLDRLRYMERQVRDMLLFVKGDIPLNEEINVHTLTKTLAEAMEAPMTAYNAQCTWSINNRHDQIRCNLDALIGALLNLINNSLQAKQQAKIQLEFKRLNSELIITVIDNGPGLDNDSINQLGELFFTTKSQGTGIGLAVVRAVAKSHGGCFTLSNSEDGGACATLKLPLLNN